MKSGFVIGIDASRNRSGGAIAHLTGILKEGNPQAHGIREVHVWSYRRLLDAVDDAPWLVKHNPPELERSLFHQVWWQFRSLAKAAKESNCGVLLTTDAATLCRFRPMVVMSQDMLSYEPGVMRPFGITIDRLRLIGILWVQNRAMRFADGIIFLTEYAARVIQQATGKLKRTAIIPHGVGTEFKKLDVLESANADIAPPIRCLYLSHLHMYKHQWVVVRAIASLRKKGHEVELILVGGGSGRPKQLLDEAIAASDPQGRFVKDLGFVRHDELPPLLADADLFVFASSCENLPVTLLEAMAVGLPIACSNRGPMPEVLQDGGVYFDPEDSESIALAIEKIMTNENLRMSIARRAKRIAEQYSWAKCASQTWDFLNTIIRN